MTTGERIKAARVAAGMTQAELADKVGVKFAAIHKYETGRIVNLKRETIGKLAKALDVRPSYLLCIDDDEDLGEAELLDSVRISVEKAHQTVLYEHQTQIFMLSAGVFLLCCPYKQ